MRASLLAVLIAACGGAAPAPAPPAAPPPSCDALQVSLGATASATAQPTVYVFQDAPHAVDDAMAVAAQGAIAACRDDHWTPDTIRCFLRAKNDEAQLACAAALPASQADSLRAHVDGAVAATKRARVERFAAHEWTDVAADTGFPACDDFIRAFNAFMHCDKVDPKTSATATGAIEQMTDGLKTFDRASPDQRKSANDGCAQAIGPLRDTAKQLGCTLP
jgi:hypothetical protein